MYGKQPRLHGVHGQTNDSLVGTTHRAWRLMLVATHDCVAFVREAAPLSDWSSTPKPWGAFADAAH